MEEIVVQIMRYTLALDSRWVIERMEFDKESERCDVYVSHVGTGLKCPVTGEPGNPV